MKFREALALFLSIAILFPLVTAFLVTMLWPHFRVRHIEKAFAKNGYVLYDSSNLSYEIIGSRKGTRLVERCVGIVTDAEKGDGRILNAADSMYDYISYRSVEGELQDGTIIMTYFIYSPDNNTIDDITDRIDVILK